MKFGRWSPLGEAAGQAPASPGIFQIRQAKGLVDYPRGKSAMLYYGCADDVSAAIAAYAAEHPDADWWCRHSIEMTQYETDNVGQMFERLVLQFTMRFGRGPSLPE